MPYFDASMNWLGGLVKTISIIAVLLGFGGGLWAANSAVGPKAVIEEIFQMVKDEKLASDSAAQKQVDRHIDFNDMADSVLGSHSKAIAKADSEWFRSTLKSIITKTVYPEAPDFMKGVKIEYVDESVGATKASIVSEVAQKGDVTEVRYDLKKKGGQWVVVDVAIDDESWVQSIREEVNDVIATKKWAGLKQRMSDRLKELDSKKSKTTK
jgi:ABC-type transporter MlaC component